MKSILQLCFLLFLAAPVAIRADERLVVGSKAFTESVILGEVVRQSLESSGLQIEHRRGLAGTEFLWSALKAGEIDMYPEYTGTIREQILRGQVGPSDEDLLNEIAKLGIKATKSVGFNNTYVLGMKEEEAERLGIRTISDLANHPELQIAFSAEFLHRQDGWPGLKKLYGLTQEPRGMDHDIAYRALESDEISVMDLYATDAEIPYYGLRTLVDDKGYFPHYDCLIVYRADLESRSPQAVEALSKLEGTLDAETMRSLNARVKLDREAEAVVAADFCNSSLGLNVTASRPSRWRRIGKRLVEHIQLVSVSLIAAIIIAIPLGIFAAKVPAVRTVVMTCVGIVQTIPALVLLVLMIPLLGIGAPPAIAAMFLYSLLPITRNTCAGLLDLSPSLKESAEVLGLTPWARLRLIELPLATRSILAGIKTSAVINVGSATLAALIGAGGLGQPIITGIRLDSLSLILDGAIPAALLAIVVQGVFELAERCLLGARAG